MLIVCCNRCKRQLSPGEEFAQISIGYKTGFGKDNVVTYPYKNLKNCHFCKDCMGIIFAAVSSAINSNSKVTETEVSRELSVVVDEPTSLTVKDADLGSGSLYRSNDAFESVSVKEKKDSLDRRGKLFTVREIINVINTCKSSESNSFVASKCGITPPTVKRLRERCFPLREKLISRLKSEGTYKGVDFTQLFSFIEAGWKAKDIADEFSDLEEDDVKNIIDTYINDIIFAAYGPNYKRHLKL